MEALGTIEKKALIVIDENRDELWNLKNLCERNKVKTQVVWGNLATHQKISAILQDKTDWAILVARHCNGKSLEFFDGGKLKMPKLLFHLGRVPEFVCLSACNTWKIGDNLHRHGAKLILATATDCVPADSYLPFVCFFMEFALQGVPARVALEETRKCFRSHYRGDHTPWQFGLIGDEDLVLRPFQAAPNLSTLQPNWQSYLPTVQESLALSSYQPDFQAYERGISQLLNQTKETDTHYQIIRDYQKRLHEINQSATDHWSEADKIVCIKIIEELKSLSLMVLGTPFDNLCQQTFTKEAKFITPSQETNHQWVVSHYIKPTSTFNNPDSSIIENSSTENDIQANSEMIEKPKQDEGNVEVIGVSHGITLPPFSGVDLPPTLHSIQLVEHPPLVESRPFPAPVRWLKKILYKVFGKAVTGIDILEL